MLAVTLASPLVASAASLTSAAASTVKSSAYHVASAADPLKNHRITGYELKRARLHWPRLVGKNARLDVHGNGPTENVVVFETSNGATGWGQIGWSPDDTRRVCDEVVGKTVADVLSPATGIRSDRWWPVDVALHDLAAVIREEPVWKMLGGGDAPLEMKIYSGMVYFDDLEPTDNPAGLDKVLENAKWDYDYGYRQLKVKIGRGNRWMDAEDGLQRDIDVIKMLHEELPDCELLVDGNDGFTADSFIKFLEGISPIPLFFIEEPFRETAADWRKLADWCKSNGYEKTLRADGEADPDFACMRELEADGTLTLRLTDIIGGGFSTWRHWMPGLQKQGVVVSPHTWGSGLKTVYAAHFGAGYGDMPTVEGVTCSDEDVDFGENKIIKNGLYQVSSEPGFGLKLRS